MCRLHASAVCPKPFWRGRRRLQRRLLEPQSGPAVCRVSCRLSPRVWTGRIERQRQRQTAPSTATTSVHRSPSARLSRLQSFRYRVLFAASTVFFSSIVTVSGPTPPGTGVIAPATSTASSKATSPT